MTWNLKICVAFLHQLYLQYFYFTHIAWMDSSSICGEYLKISHLVRSPDSNQGVVCQKIQYIYDVPYIIFPINRSPLLQLVVIEMIWWHGWRQPLAAIVTILSSKSTVFIQSELSFTQRCKENKEIYQISH